MSLYDYYDDVNADRRRDAEMEDWDDRHPPNMECDECGFEWYSLIHRSRLSPPEPENPDCPRCEGLV